MNDPICTTALPKGWRGDPTFISIDAHGSSFTALLWALGATSAEPSALKIAKRYGSAGGEKRMIPSALAMANGCWSPCSQGPRFTFAQIVGVERNALAPAAGRPSGLRTAMVAWVAFESFNTKSTLFSDALISRVG